MTAALTTITQPVSMSKRSVATDSCHQVRLGGRGSLDFASSAATNAAAAAEPVGTSIALAACSISFLRCSCSAKPSRFRAAGEDGDAGELLTRAQARPGMARAEPEVWISMSSIMGHTFKPLLRSSAINVDMLVFPSGKFCGLVSGGMCHCMDTSVFIKASCCNSKSSSIRRRMASWCLSSCPEMSRYCTSTASLAEARSSALVMVLERACGRIELPPRSPCGEAIGRLPQLTSWQ
mmetsp:Transcript_119353/g.309690  ORF Transcript_119353/g.309690 Transcript_119353/m.309690 type:complete len:236 (+) Transcript_119353:1908-2615(+)